eukprot:NODE_6017_length_887_cov_105.705497_g5788_i0.p1 GENE.NODE_6017_length_887_cov_105.705497_g5788_i0~~NODE_6017_length_887_cov_105.705497_g5788_i0.p1  ORF type:complete len:226 (+),score=28.87 NODE_6017_length_887_cov_105.705497_g5788_i0:57-734(+)
MTMEFRRTRSSIGGGKLIYFGSLTGEYRSTLHPEVRLKISGDGSAEAQYVWETNSGRSMVKYTDDSPEGNPRYLLPQYCSGSLAEFLFNRDGNVGIALEWSEKSGNNRYVWHKEFVGKAPSGMLGKLQLGALTGLYHAAHNHNMKLVISGDGSFEEPYRWKTASGESSVRYTNDTARKNPLYAIPEYCQSGQNAFEVYFSRQGKVALLSERNVIKSKTCFCWIKE